jgi:hypothetical protein
MVKKHNRCDEDEGRKTIRPPLAGHAGGVFKEGRRQMANGRCKPYSNKVTRSSDEQGGIWQGLSLQRADGFQYCFPALVHVVLPAMVLLQFSQCENGFVLRALVKMGVGVGLMGVEYRLGGQMMAVGAKIGKQNQLAHRWGILLGDNRFSSPMCKVIYLLWILI